jgi:hypothetical protein
MRAFTPARTVIRDRRPKENPATDWRRAAGSQPRLAQDWRGFFVKCAFTPAALI